MLVTSAALFALSACATADTGYPSLAVRDAERQRGVIEAPSLPEPVAPALPRMASTNVLQQIAALRSETVRAHQQFLDAAPAARRAVSAGAGAARASDAWSGAQVALADLETRRSVTAISLADLDALFADQATGFDPVVEVAEARDAIIALLEEEDRILSQLRARIR